MAYTNVKYNDDQLDQYESHKDLIKSYQNEYIKVAKKVINKMTLSDPESILATLTAHLKGTTRNAKPEVILKISDMVEQNEDVKKSSKQAYQDSYRPFFQGLDELLAKDTLTENEYKRLPERLKSNYSRKQNSEHEQYDPTKTSDYTRYVRIAGGRRSRRNRRNRRNKRKNTRRSR